MLVFPPLKHPPPHLSPVLLGVTVSASRQNYHESSSLSDSAPLIFVNKFRNNQTVHSKTFPIILAYLSYPVIIGSLGWVQPLKDLPLSDYDD